MLLLLAHSAAAVSGAPSEFVPESYTHEEHLAYCFSYKIYQQPAFFMQLLAGVMSGGILDQGNFLAINVAPYLEDAKAEIVGIAWPNNLINHPHFTESYYLLAKNIT